MLSMMALCMDALYANLFRVAAISASDSNVPPIASIFSPLASARVSLKASPVSVAVTSSLRDDWSKAAMGTPPAADLIYGRDAFSVELMQTPPPGGWNASNASQVGLRSRFKNGC